MYFMEKTLILILIQKMKDAPIPLLIGFDHDILNPYVLVAKVLSKQHILNPDVKLTGLCAACCCVGGVFHFLF